MQGGNCVYHCKHLVGVGMNGIDNSGSGMVFPAMKTLYIRFSYLPEEFFSVSFSNLEELILSASGMRKIKGVIGPGPLRKNLEGKVSTFGLRIVPPFLQIIETK